MILAELRDDPNNLTAWLWALEVADNEKEKRSILNRILTLDPSHKGALQYLKKLDQSLDTQTDGTSGPSPYDKPPQSEKPDQEVSRVGGIFRLITEWASSLPTSCGFFVLFIIIIIGAFFYFRVNTSLFGLIGNDFDDLVVSNSYEEISTEDMYWEVQFEGIGESKYIGVVRHASPIRINEFRILLTSGELPFAPPRVVAPLWVTLAETEPIAAERLAKTGWTSRAGIYTQHLVLESYLGARPAGRSCSAAASSSPLAGACSRERRGRRSSPISSGACTSACRASAMWRCRAPGAAGSR